MEIYLVRHGRTEWNDMNVLQGLTDVYLNDEGIRLAKLTAEALKDVYFDKIFTSPLSRAYDTAEILENGRGIPILKYLLLEEISFGAWEGKDVDELSKNKNLMFQHFFTEPQYYLPTRGGETIWQLRRRANYFMEHYIEPEAETCSRIMIVGHGAINQAIMAYVRNIPESNKGFWTGGLQKNCSVIILDYTDGKYTIKEESKIYYDEEEKQPD